MPAGRTAVDAVVWRHDGTLRVTVIAKATFSFADEAAMERTDAQPIFRAEVHHGQSPTRSIRFSVDRVPYLNRGEVLFTGHAYAVAGTAIGMMPVRLGVFDGARALLDKTLRVRRKGGVEGVPLAYEHAYGGPGFSDNPYGIGAVIGSGEPDVIALEGAKHLAGFAPLGQAWTARKRRLGSYPRPALEGYVVEVPADFDWAYFQAAPPDQWAPFLRGDEWIVMDGLHPALPRARMRLPGAIGAARVYGLSASGVAEGQPLALHADVLRIDGDEQRCSLTFRGVFPVADEAAVAALRVVAGVDLPGDPIPWPDPATLAADDGVVMLSDEDLEPVPAAMYDGTLSLGEGTARVMAQREVVPFHAAAAPEIVAPGSNATRALEADPSSLQTLELSGRAGERAAPDALPFHAATEEPAPPTERQPRPPPPIGAASFESTMALDGSSAARAALPFGATPAVAPPAPVPPPPPDPPAYVATPPPPPAPVPPPPPLVEPPPPEVVRAEPPAPAPAPPPPPEPPRAAPVVETPRASPWAPAPEAPPPAPRAPRPQPPPMQSPPSDALKKGLYGRFGGR